MAAIFCLFSVAMCSSSHNDVSNGLSLEGNGVATPLSAQIISVPRVYISPCPVAFRYAFNGREWFGLVVVGNPARAGIPSKLKVILSLGFHYSFVSQKVSMNANRKQKFNFLSFPLSEICWRNQFSKRQAKCSQRHFKWSSNPLPDKISASKSDSKGDSNLLQRPTDL